MAEVGKGKGEGVANHDGWANARRASQQRVRGANRDLKGKSESRPGPTHPLLTTGFTYYVTKSYWSGDLHAGDGRCDYGRRMIMNQMAIP